jgi:hypothetical protein
MRELLRDIALSFCPDSVRSIHRPSSSSGLLLVAILSGPLQTVLCAYWLLSGYKAFLVARAAQYGDVLNRANQTTQGWMVLVFLTEYVLFHPLAFFLAYIALEGFIRFAGALCVSELVPSLPVVLVFKLRDSFQRRKSQRQMQPLASLPDSIEVLEEGGRLRIATGLPKAGWNASLTISVQGEWYELESEVEGEPPRAFVYILRRAAIGKVLRGYQEYDPAGAVMVKHSAR